MQFDLEQLFCIHNFTINLNIPFSNKYLAKIFFGYEIIEHSPVKLLGLLKNN